MASGRRRSRINSTPDSLANHEQILDLSDFDLNNEVDRRKSFNENGWSDETAKYEDLALIGFYFLMKPDIVRCQFCDLIVRNFKADDVPLKLHQNRSPNCPLLIRRVTCANVAINQSILDELLPEPSYDEFGFTSRKVRRRSKAEVEIAYPEYRLLQDRIKTFKMWPVGLNQKPQELANAGFFYSGQSDLVICFSCGLFLCQWQPNDNVWIEHKQLATKTCSYLNLNHETVKLNEQRFEAQEGVKKLSVCEATSSSDSTDETAAVAAGKEDLKFESLCKICLENRANVIFMPCRHVAVCGSCVFGLNDICPICRAEVVENIDLFYA